MAQFAGTKTSVDAFGWTFVKGTILPLWFAGSAGQTTPVERTPTKTRPS